MIAAPEHALESSTLTGTTFPYFAMFRSLSRIGSLKPT